MQQAPLWPTIPPHDAETRISAANDYSTVLKRAIERLRQFSRAVSLAQSSTISEEQYLDLKRNFLVLEDMWTNLAEENNYHSSLISSVMSELAVFKFIEPSDVEILGSRIPCKYNDVVLFKKLLLRACKIKDDVDKQWLLAEEQHSVLQEQSDRFQVVPGKNVPSQSQWRVAPIRTDATMPSWRHKGLVLTGHGDVTKKDDARFTTHKWPISPPERGAKPVAVHHDPVNRQYKYGHGTYCSVCPSDRLGTRDVWPGHDSLKLLTPEQKAKRELALPTPLPPKSVPVPRQRQWYDRLSAIGDGPAHSYSLGPAGGLTPITHHALSSERRADTVKVNYRWEHDDSRVPYSIQIPSREAAKFARAEVGPVEQLAPVIDTVDVKRHFYHVQ